MSDTNSSAIPNSSKSVDDELFTNNFHEWLEQNGCTYIGMGNGYSISYQIDVNRLKVAITQLFAKQIEEAEIRVARNAMAIALDWLENDGRGKHLVQDMWDVRDISVLDHIEKRFIDEAGGHFPATIPQDTKGGTDDTTNTPTGAEKE